MIDNVRFSNENGKEQSIKLYFSSSFMLTPIDGS